jgi:hypothetical protein
LQGPAHLFRRVLRGLALAHELPDPTRDSKHLLFAGSHSHGLTEYVQRPIGRHSGFHQVGEDQDGHGRRPGCVFFRPPQPAKEVGLNTPLQCIGSSHEQGSGAQRPEGVLGHTELSGVLVHGW